MWTWDQLVEFFNKNTAALIGFAGVLIGIVLNKFAPWIGTVLQRLGGALFALVGGRWKDYAFERKYLDWLIGRHRYLGQLPSNVAVATGEQKQLADLEQVYVALSVTPGGAPGDVPADAERLGRATRRYRGERERVWWSRLVPKRFRPADERPYSNVGRAIAQNPRLVIRGDPGSGKTTLMKYLAVTCARALRNKPREGDHRDATYDRLGWVDRPFPIFISLGRHGNVKGWDTKRTLLDACADEFACEQTDCPPGFFERRLKRGNCLILLDAFDELGSRDARQQMAQHITGLLNKFADAKNRVVVTTRIVGYEGQLDPRGFNVLTVQKLTDEDIAALVRQRYRAIAINESPHRPASEVDLAQRRAANKADQLLGEIKRNPRLRLLAENPLLLSLIVLDHSVKLVLPEDRHILYRDCVEILAAKWRKHSRGELNVPVSDDAELTLSQKIDLLQTIALEMQKQRTRPNGERIPIRRARAEELIAAQLPALLAALPSDATQRRLVCEQKATAWLDGIKAESGILIELGLDDAGEPLVAFSHLTFQEYLAALTIKEAPSQYPLLLDNLLNPAWEEVLLLYVGITQQATPVVQKLIAHAPTQPGAWLTAGRCLIEKTQVDVAERKTVLTGLHNLAQTGEENRRGEVCGLLQDIAAPDSAPVLAQIAEQDAVWQVRYAAARALGKIGDPRFDHIEPEMVTIPAGEFVMGSDTSGQDDEKPQHRVNLPAYRIGKYPVTNAEYKRFVDDGGYTEKHQDCWTPEGWQWRANGETDKPPYLEHREFGVSNRPVVTVSWYEAVAYCNWLTKTSPTKRVFRLPTEAEWEKAARGPSTGAQDDAREYPWGNEFSKDKCNTSESKIGTPTPVGIYRDGASPFGVYDLAGNVWEWCSTRWGKGGNTPDFKYPYRADDGREELLVVPSRLNLPQRFLRLIGRYDERIDLRVLRGGSWSYSNYGARCASRFRGDPDFLNYGIGLRVAESPQ